jgi:hypothetical protein
MFDDFRHRHEGVSAPQGAFASLFPKPVSQEDYRFDELAFGCGVALWAMVLAALPCIAGK